MADREYLKIIERQKQDKEFQKMKDDIIFVFNKANVDEKEKMIRKLMEIVDEIKGEKWNTNSNKN